jgi:hypothetical protein
LAIVPKFLSSPAAVPVEEMDLAAAAAAALVEWSIPAPFH